MILGYAGEEVHRVVAVFAVYADTKEATQNLSEGVRKILSTGKLPEGYVLHHKTPLFRHGSNNIENLTVQKEAIYKKYDNFLRYSIPGMAEAPKAFIEAGYKGGSRYYTLVGDEIVHAYDLIKKLKPEVQEQLKHMHIPEKPLVPGGGLLKQELNRGHHAIEEHVIKNDSSMYARRAEGRQGPISTFKNLEEAEYFVAETIKKNQDEIEVWLKTEKRSMEFELPFEKITGRLLKEGEETIVDVRGVRVVLKSAKETPEGYTVLTAYPIK